MLQDEATIFGFRMSRRGLHGDTALARRIIAAGQSGRYMACANPHSLVVASRDEIFRMALSEADLLIPDGVGILLAGKALGASIKERVTGSEFFLNLTQSLANDGGARYFFLGSSEHVLNLIVERMRLEFPQIIVCGALSPPFKPEFSETENAAMISAINTARPDVLWVGMTAPKQEKWIFKNRDKIKIPFIGAIGAVFDFYAGTKKRSSASWQKLGLEWVPRFLREPRRLWERNLKSMPVFLYWIAKEKLKELTSKH